MIDEMKPQKFAHALFDYLWSKREFMDALADAGFDDYGCIGGDDYDCSAEFYKVGNDARMSEAAQRVVFDAGFARAYVNHFDGWETHYNWPPEFAAHRGWRRRYVKDADATTTRSISHPDDTTESGYFEISYWPDGWGDSETGKCADWLKSGYMRIVPEPAA